MTLSEDAQHLSRGGSTPTLRFLADLLLLAFSALLFTFSFPSFLSKWGWFPIAFFAIFPLFIVIRRNNWVGNVLLGFLYGYATYALYNFWLSKFHPLAHIIVPVIFAVYFAILFPVLKLTYTLFPRYGYLVQFAVWIAYEYLRTLGFVGYGYGILGYSQYLFLPLIQLASLTGVWGVSALVVFPSVYLGNALAGAGGGPRSWLISIQVFYSSHRIAPIVYGFCFITAIIFGVAQKSDFGDQKQWRVALIQQNVDPWHGELAAYTNSFNILSRLSDHAMIEDPDIVVWSETAFVPGIDWHTRYRTNQGSYRLVKRLREYLDVQSVPFVIGNDDGQLEKFGLPPVNPDGSLNRLDYNASLLYIDGEIIETYRKLHLVPFTEGFPFEDSLPGIYNWLKAADTHFWEKGDEYVVFEANGVKFSTPICFEDTFGYLSRGFVQNGAQVIVNMTNDSWSKSIAAEMQHMNMAVFRAVENGRTVIRSTNGGITCTIEPDGRITSMLDPFVEDFLVNDVPVYDAKTTLYTRWGDWAGISFLIVSGLLFLYGTGVALFRRFSRSSFN
ncbi:MAG: apolipoprotein N-acyltransferase [Spirochaetales bacterium]|jgi:apolipoprotein N-acyltransferase|nr:apolipoprotein N-acyltransferase [Spirochaetales bacterium]